MPQRLELLLQVREVVDFAVGNQLNLTGLVRERLLTAREVDNRQPPHREPNPGERDAPLLVRPAMHERTDHPLQVVQHDRTLRIRFDDADDAAHRVLGLEVLRS